ncbi:hypothetical protein BP5796_10597 [Coleophoma crateriformis]|uniref:Heterokaryon incompatibility domain-containing protein n=1 Tax=Coleophoma crateriformis TaxID=565419 RepID=A0A3D8QQM1_9HELO|nr:hypothetical protein BP5796_10597 [Coleophoma crateriformis]
MEFPYRHEALTGTDSIRLLRILPSKDTDAPLQVQLFDYILDGTLEETHPYEALSYVWGNLGTSCSIFVHKYDSPRYILPITSNLHKALLHLRYPVLERVIWVDAICINQNDNKEKEQQIRLMYKIFTHANCVLVWLGEEADDSDQVLEELRVTGRKKAANFAYEETVQESVVKLLRRDWFLRIWVLQEVAAARRIQILYGRSKIDGYAFCLAMDSLRKSVEAHNELQTLQSAIRSITYLIRGAIFRPYRQTLGTVSEAICPLGELVDMFRTHQASKPQDKVYALLGMSSDDMNSDDMSKPNLLPDYSVPYEELLIRLVKFVLSDKVHVETQKDREVAVIKGKGCILGSIFSIEGNMASDNKQRVRVSWRGLLGHSKASGHIYTPWILQSSAIPLQRGDLICLLRGATKPTIIRVYGDFSAILVIAASPPYIEIGGEHLQWLEVLQRINLFNRDLTLIWDRNYLADQLTQLGSYSAWVRSNDWKLGKPDTDTEDHLDEATRLWNCALILTDGREFDIGQKRFQEGIASYEKAFESKGWQTPKSEPELSAMLQGIGSTYDTIPDLLLLKDNADRMMMHTQYASAPLAWAIRGGQRAMAKLWLQLGDVNINHRDEAEQTLLTLAASYGQLDIVERLLQANADVNAAAADGGRTALQAAAEGGHLKVVERLLQANADVNAAAAGGYSGRTALQAAAEGGHLGVVERLLQANAEVNAAAAAGGRNGRTALQAAAQGGHLKVVERLLQANADVNAAADGGRTALQAAAEGGHFGVVEQLLQANADVNTAAAEELNGRTALQAAAQGGHLKVVERLLQANADVNVAAAAGGRNGRTALQAAAEGGHLKVVERLLQANAEVNAAAARYNGRTALQAAAEGGYLDVVERLLQANAKVNTAAARYDGRTALQAAAQGGHLKVVEQLLQANADVNAVVAGVYIIRPTALQAAARGGHLKVVERLLQANADVNVAAADRGRTALQAAAGGGHLKVVERLLQANADVNAAVAEGGRNGRTAIQAAAEGGHLGVVERLLQANADVNAAAADGGRTALQAAAEGGHFGVVERLLQANAEVNAAAARYHGRTALQAAAQGGHLGVVERLLQANADVNAAAAEKGNSGRTALQAAAEGGHLDVVERLLQANAKVNAAAGGYNGRTALQAAAEGGYLDIVERLLQANADVNAAAADDGRMALQAAAQGGHLKVVEQLLQANADVNAAAAGAYIIRPTALQAAAEGGHLKVVERLVEAGAT